MKLVKTEYTINSSNPYRPEGLRAAVLADFHDRDHEAVLTILEDDVPDIILIPGDVVLGYFPENHDMVIDRCTGIIPFLEGCASLAPTYMSVGNHECLLCAEEYDVLRRTGVTILDNEWTAAGIRLSRDHSDELPATQQVREKEILIGGLTSAHAMCYRKFREEYNEGRSGAGYVRYPYRRRPRDINRYPAESAWLRDFERQDGYRILLCHHPEYWAEREPFIRDMNIDCVISGHAHGGQWRILGRGIYSPGQGLLPAYTSGLHEGPHGTLAVSRGLSNPYRVLPRLGNPPEVVYLEFR